ncbi:MAG: bifunctional histidine phosphatase family protein/GNAT family N-acetyltransferase [Eubacteriales bacterium]|nr:bifunctional histidine phosphatase family protein/GNAT family N-acetyltransferase [Eubacteriales bacterium]
MMTLYLIRHAESEGNLFRICQGQDDELLTSTGLAQCRALGARFRSVPLSAVYTSDLYRAAMTAQAVAKPRRIKLSPDPALREIHLGPLEGRSWGDVYRELPALRTTSVHALELPGCETRADVARRMTRTLTAIARRHDGEAVAAVSHGGAISAFLDAILPDVSLDLAGNTSVTTLIYDTGRWKLVSPPDLSHLTRAGVPSAALFREGQTDLWFDDLVPGRDDALIDRTGRDAWLAVFGNLTDYRPTVFRDNARRLLGRPGLAVRCMDGDTVAGMLLLDADQQDEPDIGHISLVYLEPAYRRRGLGMQLIGHAVVVYRALGRSVLRLHVSQRNKPAVRLYQKCGFRFTTVPCSLSGQLVMKKNIGIPKLF